MIYFINYFSYVVFCFACFAILIKVAFKFSLLDFPHKRKNHEYPVPYLGGFGIIICYMFSLLLFKFSDIIIYILFFSLILNIFQLTDDKYSLNVFIRLFFQILITFFIIVLFDIKVYNLGYIPYFGTVELGSLSIFFTIICVILIINSINYFDGINGMAASIFIITLFNFLFLAYLNHQIFIHYLILIIPPIIFLLFNFKFLKLPRIFLGNNGSTMIGFIISFLSIELVFFYDLGVDQSLIIWVLALIVYEFISTTLSRIIRSKPIFLPGHDHIHYLLGKLFDSNKKALIVIILINQLLFLLGFLLNQFSSLISLTGFFILFFVFFYFREKILVKLLT